MDSQIESVGDANGDGYPDLMMIVPVNGDPELWLLSGKDGATLRKRPALATLRHYTNICGIGDCDGDGEPDYLLVTQDRSGAAGPNIFQARRVRDDALLWQIQTPWSDAGGQAMVGDLDLDGDGRPDVLFSAPYANQRSGQIEAYSSAGRLLYKIRGSPQYPIAFAGTQYELAKLGDLTGDGCDDFVALGWDFSVGARAGLVISGRDGRELVRGSLNNSEFTLRPSVGALGDIDGDGFLDFFVGASNASAYGGFVVAFSGKDGHRIWAIRENDPNKGIGLALKGGFDFNRDGIQDILASSHVDSTFILSGKDGSKLLELPQPRFLSDSLGWHLIACPPAKHEVFPRFLITDRDYYSNPYNQEPDGRLMCFEGRPNQVWPYGQACAGTLGKAPRIGMTVLKPKGMQVHVFDAPAGALAVLMLGSSRTDLLGLKLPARLDGLGLPGCELLTSADLTIPTLTGTVGANRGRAMVGVPGKILRESWETMPIHVQWVVLGSGVTFPGALSDALQWSTYKLSYTWEW